jgi:hypothetical protein
MVEQAFRITNGSKLYNEYFETQAEKQKMHDLARVFFEKHDLLDDGLGYCLREDLVMQLTAEQQDRYANQLKKLVDRNEMYYFKKSSPMYKEWVATVASKVDMKVIDQLCFWYWPYIGQGQYALWHHDDELYGYLSDYHKDALELPEYFECIKMSEYYAVKELRNEG